MDGLYRIMDAILPFEWANYAFMKHALLAVLLVTALFGLLGTMVVSNRMAFFSDSLGHGAFTGIAIGALLGGLHPLWGAILFAILFALGITIVKNRIQASADTIIGVFSSIAVALGLVLISFAGNYNKYASYLVGDLLSIRPSELVILLIVFVLVIALWVIIFNRLLLISIHPSLAASRGVMTLNYESMFAAAVAVVVTLAMQWVGLLVINALLVLPAAAARNIAANVRQYHLFSLLIALFSGITGLILSYYWNTVTGATIVLVAGVCFLVTLVFRRRMIGG